MYRMIICTVILVVVAGVPEDEIWTKFKKDHGRFYTSQKEETLRYQIFQDNVKEINEHNHLYLQGKSTFFKGINQFTDLTKEEFVKKMLGPTRTQRQIIEPNIIWKVENITDDVDFPPDSIDWRESNVVTPVGQQKCNDYWAFSTASMLESRYALKREVDAFQFSKQNLIDCSQSAGNSGCAGGYSYASYQYLKEHGIMNETDYPYTGTDGTCHFVDAQKVLAVTAGIYVPEKNETEFLMALASIGPLAISLDATNMASYAGGVFQDHACSTDALNFAAVVVGYDSENGEKYYIVKNSWGTGWGEKGYIRMARDYNICGICSDASWTLIDDV